MRALLPFFRDLDLADPIVWVLREVWRVDSNRTVSGRFDSGGEEGGVVDSPEETLADLPTFLTQVKDVWERWHERFGMTVPPLPRRRFPDGSMGPEAGGFFGREDIGHE